MFKHGAKLIAALTTLCQTLSFVSFARVDEQVDIKRQGSQVEVSWHSHATGTWTLLNETDKVCATGVVHEGANTVRLHKVSPADDLKWTVKLRGSTDSQITHLPKQTNYSQMGRLDRAGVIYQLPVRTYLARDRGEAAAGKLTDLSDEILGEIKDLGVDYVWLTGILEQASRSNQDPDVVKGEAGSFYAIYDLWDVSPQVGTINDLVDVINRAHHLGLRVMIDFVANHTARVHRTDVGCKQHLNLGSDDRRDQFFDTSNNYYYIQNSHFVPPHQPGVEGADGIYDQNIFEDGIQLEQPARVTGNDVISARPRLNDWFETAKINYGFNLHSRSGDYSPRPRTWEQMVDVAKYWAALGVDGFRVDFAHSVPIEFWRYFVEELRAVQPDIFLLAEAYESDEVMRLPNFSYEAMFAAGFDSIYNSYVYWAMRDQALQAGHIDAASYLSSPAGRPLFFQRGYAFTHYMENHDEVRVASRHFASSLNTREQRAALGRAYTAYLALLPGNFLLHGGQEVMEDAGVHGQFAGDNGRTSIFDFVYQSQTRQWLQNQTSDEQQQFRDSYAKLLRLKRSAPFNQVHREGSPNFIDLMPANASKPEAAWINAYLRYNGDDVYLVVTNSDPINSHETTIHFTDVNDQDRFGALRAMHVRNDDERHVFVEMWLRDGWMPSDPNSRDAGVTGSMLYRASGVPSGLYLDVVPAATTYVFKLVKFPLQDVAAAYQ